MKTSSKIHALTHIRPYDAVVFALGFILSPLSWWNDLVVNVPLAYILSYPFTILDESFFLPAFILAYWFTNLIGLLMLHRSSANMLSTGDNKWSLMRGFLVSLFYTVLMVVLVLSGFLKSPLGYLK